MFHVEHAPVDETAAVSWPLVQKPMRQRIDQLKRYCLHDIRDSGMVCFVQSQFDALPGPTNSDPVRPCFHERIPTRTLTPAQFRQVLRSEASAPDSHEQGLQHAGLAGSVVADDQIQTRVRMNLELPIQANIFAPQQGDAHFTAASA